MEKVLNRSYGYILPLLDFDSDFVINSQFRGCFVGDEDYPELDNHIFLLYEFSGQSWFLNFEKDLKDKDLFITSYDPDKKHAMYVYEPQSEFLQDYKLIKESKYSEISKNAKAQIISFYKEVYPKSVKHIEDVLYKKEDGYKKWEEVINEGLPKSRWTKIPRELEATSVMDMSIEVYNNRFKEASVLGGM